MIRGILNQKNINTGLVFTIGFMLSPLTWWNDLFINIPLAYAIGVLLGFIQKSFFVPGMIGGYFLTNIFGLILIHKAIIKFTNTQENKKYSVKDFSYDMLISLGYTGIIILLAKLGLLKFPTEYF